MKLRKKTWVTSFHRAFVMNAVGGDTNSLTHEHVSTPLKKSGGGRRKGVWLGERRNPRGDDPSHKEIETDT